MMSKNKFALIGIFAVLFLSLGIVSATTSSVFTISNVSAPANISETSGSFSFTFNLTYTGTSESKDFTFVDSTSSIGSVSIPDSLGFNGTIHESRIITGVITNFVNQGGNSMVVRINASSGSIRDDETTFTVAILEEDTPAPSDIFCEFGKKGTLKISDFSINNLGNGDDNEWEPLDEIEIEVEIENTDNDDSVSDVNVEIKIMDGNNDVTNDFDFDDEKIDLGKIRADDTDIATFKINEVLADLDERTYKLFIKAYSDGDEDLQCISESTDFDNSKGNDFYHEIEFIRQDDPAVIIKNTDLAANKILASCGDKSIDLSFDVYNIGSDKEEKTLITIFNKELGINQADVINNLRSGKKTGVTFFVNIPQNLTKKRYDLAVTTYFEYDKGDELDIFSYDSNSDADLDRTFKIPVEILSCGITKEPTIDAKLESEAKVGEELIITVSITNEGNEKADFLISVSGYSSWAELKSDELKTISIEPGKTQELAITFVPEKDGLQSFTIGAIVSGKTYDQSVSVNVAEEEGKEGLFKNINWNDPAIYLITGIILLVILIIITLIVKLSRKNKRTQFSDLS